MCGKTEGSSPIHNKTDEKFESKLFFPEGDGRQGEGGLRTQRVFKKSLPTKPLITVVTAVYNGEKFLEKTIQSIINQTYENVEYVIIDGGSTDGTLDIIRKYEHAIDYWVSEKDQGISDAFNKAVTLSSGDFINFQGDGDGFYELDSIETISRKIKSLEDVLICGKICRIDEFGKQLYFSKQKSPFNKKSLLFKMSLPHQGLFINKVFFKKYGLFDVNNTFCMDYEHLLRAYAEFPTVTLVDTVIANWRDDGVGSGRILEVLREYHQIKKKNNVASALLLLFIKYWSYFKYYVRKALT